MLLKTIRAGGIRLLEIHLDPEADTVSLTGEGGGGDTFTFVTAHEMSRTGTALIEASIRWKSLHQG